MMIDWFTVCAQALNFIVLLWLMKRFLYKPILSAIDAREQEITKVRTDATAQQDAARKSREDYEQKNKGFDEQRRALMEHATLEAHDLRERLINDAQHDSAVVREQQREATRVGSAALVEEMLVLATDEVYSIARKALNDLASADLETQMTEKFLQSLNSLNPESKLLLGAALSHPDTTPMVRSRFALSASQRASIEHAVNTTFAIQRDLQFDTRSAAASGIELSVGGQRLEWGVDMFLTELKTRAKALLAETPPSDEPATAAPSAMRASVSR